jgi:hypothetical protein
LSRKRDVSRNERNLRLWRKDLKWAVFHVLPEMLGLWVHIGYREVSADEEGPLQVVL